MSHLVFNQFQKNIADQQTSTFFTVKNFKPAYNFHISAPFFDPFFFLNFIRSFVAPHHVQRIEITTLENFTSCERLLGMQDLFGNSVLWLGDVSTVSDSFKKHVIQLINLNKGPHSLIFFDRVNNYDEQLSVCSLKFPDYVDRNDYAPLVSFFHSIKPITIRPDFIEMLFAKKKSVSFELALKASMYQGIIGKTLLKEFFIQYSALFFELDYSLFSLAELFFKRSPAVFKFWIEISPVYAYPFWVRFWSDQLWFAYQFVKQAQQIGGSAKDKSRRLPFSFTSYEWKNYSLEELAQAHSDLIQIDYEVKQGVSVQKLDIFILEFVKKRRKI